MSDHPRRRGLHDLRVWLDIENPPQVQYLAPFVRTFETRGCDVLVTARDYGFTLDLLRQQDIRFTPVGKHFGAKKRDKVVGTVKRIQQLRKLVAPTDRDLVLSASRSASLAARSLGVVPFVLCDYEYVNLFSFRVAGAYVVHPDVIPSESFARRGISPSRMLPYSGIKEEITFGGVDLEAVPRHEFPELQGSTRIKVLFRPPAEESHYVRAESSALARSALEWLAEQEGVAVIFSPRYDWQVESLGSFRWKVPPLVLDEPVPFGPLLRGVDVVVSGGGTMTREAAYLGVPAVSLFRGDVGGVDRHLASLGRLSIVASGEELATLDLAALVRHQPLRENPAATDDIANRVARAVLGAR